MTATSLSEEDIFQIARRIDSAEARRAYVEQTCRDNATLRAQVETLLAAFDASQSFLEAPAAEIAAAIPTHDQSILDQTDTVIGPYKLLQQIGEGGMGTVYMAEQNQPVVRKVALKIIKSGMDSRLVIARFEAERQALALMDHPNIAKMLDAGATDTGQPYFVMELVKGVAITTYCDQQRLNPKERLNLFISVCSAVQHAHQKGIIHRDLKPTNVLVADYDNRPVTKIIDFGVAKAVGQPLTDRTMFTEFGQVLGTIEYMSPEQAKLNQLDIDTRTDIYSLGVLLYELLSGSTPFDKQRLRSAAFDEMLRIIREDEPPKPSTRLSTSQALPSIAANRQLEPKKLTTTVSGDLDWIVMKSLEKDRARRYDTATGLAEDVQRYLADLPVEARRPTRMYRLKKFIRRNKAAVISGTAIGVALLLGLLLSAFGFLHARLEARRADGEAKIARAQEATANRVTEFLQQMLISANPYYAKSPDYKVRELLDDFADRFDAQLVNQPEVAATLHATIGEAYDGLEEFEKARYHLQRALDLRRTIFGPQHELYADSLIDYALNDNSSGTSAEFDKQEAKIRQALAIYRARAVEPKRIVHAFYALQEIFVRQQNFNKVEAVATEAQTEFLKSPDEIPLSECPAGWLVHVKLAHGELAEAESLAREWLARIISQYGREHMQTAWQLKDLGDVLRAEGKYGESLETVQKSLVIMTKCAPPGHDATENVREQIFNTLDSAAKAHALLKLCASADRLTEMESLFHQTPPTRPRYPSNGFDAANVALRVLPQFPSLYLELGDELSTAGDVEEAAKCRQKAIKLFDDLETELVDTPNRLITVLGYCAAFSPDKGQRAKAREQCRNLLALPLEGVPSRPLNEVAWGLATDADSGPQDYALAIALANKNVELAPSSGNYWNTLGVARYRADQWEPAIQALQKSMGLRHGGDSYDWFFLAMAHWQLGHHDEARTWYDKALQWTQKNKPEYEDLLRFQTEAKTLLKITDEKPTTKPESE